MPQDNKYPVTTLVNLLVQQASQRGDETLYTFLSDDQAASYTLSYAELDHQARCIAAQLQSLNAEGERALLLYPSNLDFLAGFFGALYAGVIAVPAYPPRKNQNADRLRSIIKDSDAKFVLASSQVMRIAQPMLQELGELSDITFIATDQLPDELANDWSACQITPDSLAFLQYTSGSTGDPKGVMLSHGNLLYNQEMIRVGVTNNTAGAYVSWLPLFHDMGLGAALQVLYRGSEGCLMAPATFIQRPQRWLWAISDHKASMSGGPNFAFDLCVKTFKPELYEGLDLSSWRVAFNGAEPIKTATLEAFSRIFAPYGFRPEAFQPCYGLAEATVGVSSGDGGLPIKKSVSLEALQEHKVSENPISPDDTKLTVACGHSWLDDDLRIVNPENCKEAGPNEVGEIWLNSPSVGAGYWRRAELSERTFRATLADAPGVSSKHYLRTGDLGFLDDGQLYVTGRIKELLIIRGRNYYPTDIEHEVAASGEALAQNGIAAFAVEHNNEEHLVLVCEIERKHLRSFDAETLSEKICQKVAEQFELRVEGVVFVKPGRLPKTSSGKIQRGLCSSQFSRRRLEAVAAWVGPALSPLSPRLSPVKRSGVAALEHGVAEKESVVEKKTQHAPEVETKEKGGDIKSWLIAWFADQLDLPESMISPTKNLASLGVDSLLVMRTNGELSHLLGYALPIDLLWEYPTINQISEALAEQKTIQLSQVEPWMDAASQSEIHYPASPAQNRHWLMHQFKHLKSAYNLTAAYRLRGELHVESMRLGLQELERRHSALRTAFEMQDGSLQQRILPAKSYLLEVEDLSALSVMQQDKKLTALLEEESRHHFDLSRAPLSRTRLLYLGPDDYVLQLNLHHIIADGWSVESLLSELSGFYASFCKDAKTLQAQELPLQFVDYLHWQRQNESQEVREKQLEYWRKKLISTPALALRTDYPRPAEPSGEGAHLRFVVPQALERSLRELCVREEVTLYHLLLSTLSLLLSRYARQDIVCIGSPAANRPHRDLSGVAGVFVNTLVMRNNLSGNPSFDELLKRVKKNAQEAYRHQDLPFDQLVNELGAGGDLSYSSLFQVMLVVQPFALEESLALQGVKVEPIDLESGSAKFDLGFEFREQAGQLHGTLEYRTDLFAAETAENLTSHLVELLQQIVQAPQAPIDSISIVPKEERNNLLILANCESRCPSSDHTLVQVFERHAEQHGNAIALRYENEQLSYRQLNQRANQMARQLVNENVRPGDLVGLSIERSLDLVVAMLAIMKTGAAYVPVDPQSPLKRTQMIFEDANIKALISHSSRKDNLPDSQNCVFIDTLELDKIPAENLSYRGSVDDTAYVIYTSGTTGQPKGVIVTHRNVVRLFSETDDWFHFNERDVWTLFHSYGFDFSVWEIWGALLYGGKLVIVPHWVTRSPAQFAALLEKEKVSVLNQTPAAFYSLSKASLSGESLPAFSLRYIIFGGDALETQKIEPWVKKFGLDKPQLINMYGITETTVHVTYHRVREEDLCLNIAPIGRPIPDNQLYLLDASGDLCAMGVPGEIHVGGGGVSKGYLDREGLNKQRFIPNPFTDKKGEKLYRSGDLAYYDNEGLLCYLGRIDHQVKVRGYRIELGDIENCLNTFSSKGNHSKSIRIKSSSVLALPDRNNEKQLVAYVVPSYGENEGKDEVAFVKAVRVHVNHFLPTFMMPSKYILVDELPLTINGKVDVTKLKALEKYAVNASLDVKANSETEKYLVDLWQETLGLKPVGIDDSFFELGGHSLLAVQILNQVKEKLSIEVPTAEVFQRPTIRQLAQYIDAVRVVIKDNQQKQASDGEDRQEFEI